MLASSGTFSIMAACAKGASQTCDWRLVGTARAGLMFVFAAVLIVAGRVRPAFLGPPSLWLRSIAGSLGLLCTFYAVKHLPISVAVTLMHMYPLWLALLSWPILGERPTVGIWVALTVGIAGVAFIAQPRLQGLDPSGLAAGVGNSIFTAIAMIGLHKSSAVDTRAVVAHFAALATLVAGACLFVFQGPSSLGPAFEGPTAILLLGVGAAGTLAQLGMTRAFTTGTPSRVAVISLTQIVFGLGFDRLVWDRPINGYTLLGITLVSGPTAWVLLAGRGPKETREA